MRSLEKKGNRNSISVRNFMKQREIEGRNIKEEFGDGFDTWHAVDIIMERKHKDKFKLPGG